MAASRHTSSPPSTSQPTIYQSTACSEETESSARKTAGSRTGEQIDRAIRKARREVMCRFELVNRINVAAHELLDKQVLIRATLSALLALMTTETRQAPTGAARRERIDKSVGLLVARADEMEAASEARALAEQRYLDSCQAMFPALRQSWDEELHATRELAVMGITLCEIEGIDPPPVGHAEAISERAAILLADLVELAKVTALEKLGEGTDALPIAVRWARSRLGSASESELDSAALAATL